MNLVEVVARHRRTQNLAADKTKAHVAAAWRKLDPSDLSGSWAARTGPDTVKAVTTGQFVAATVAQPYVSASLEAQNVSTDTQGRVNPRTFAGAASDGRSLDGLLYLPVIHVKQEIAAGRPVQDALNSGLKLLTSYATTMVADAGRAATGVARSAATRSTGYIREVSGSCCSRCAILSGRWYRWNADFARHAGCSCTEVPAGDERAARSVARDPAELFREGRIRDLSVADTQAVRDGADLARVVNAHRGMYTAGGRSFTREGVARGRFPRGGRITPEQIYREAGGSRTEALKLLYRFGYLT